MTISLRVPHSDRESWLLVKELIILFLDLIVPL